MDTNRGKLSFIKKKHLLERAAAGESVVSLCRYYGISRKTFYKWWKRWTEASPEKKSEALEEKLGFRETINHPRKVSSSNEQLILSIVQEKPQLSIPRIREQVPKTSDGQPTLSYRAIQKVLERHDLSTLEKRILYAKEHAILPEVAPERIVEPVSFPEWLTVESLKGPRVLNPFGMVREGLSYILSSNARKSFSLLALVGLFFLGYNYLSMLYQAGEGAVVGMLFASVALFFGLLFFLYSLKYYFTIAVVLSYSKDLSRDEVGEGSLSRFFAKISSMLPLFRQETSDVQQKAKPEGIQKAGLLGNLDTVELTYKPFVSIHVATYNEKRVVQRLLIACTSQDYPNYEVVIADDSTDETVGILEKWKDHPKVKIVHRSDRTGFKGGALKYALEQTDPRAEFVIIFDADFIPYSDTITQFMKYFKVSTGKLDAFQDYKDNNIAAIQGYQWHVLNKSENWLTRGVRSEFAGSYVMERSGSEIFGGLKMIAGSVYMIRRDVLQAFSWGTSITEDFELTLRIYEAGFKVVYTPYVQAPSECVSTVKRLIRQRMRWAEGHSFNVKQMFWRLLKTPYMSVNEKLEFLYLSPYYLQSFFFIVGTVSWLVSEVVFHAKLPFWTVLWGWSLVFSNMLSLPLMNSVGLFLEEAEERDYFGVASFFIMSYVLIPFQAYASIKGFLESEEGGWFRTPKSGKITDTFTKGKFYRWFRGILGWRTVGVAQQAIAPAYSINGNSAHNVFQSFDIRPQKARWIGKVVLTALLVFTLTIYSATKGVPLVYAENPTGPFYLRDESSGVLTGTSAEWRVADNSADTTDSTSTVASVNNKEAAPKWYQYKPGTTNLDEETGTSCSANTPDNAGWIFEMPFGVGGDIASGTWTFYFNEVDDRSGNVGTLEVCVWRVSVSGGVITASTLLYGTDSDGSWPTTDIWDAAVTNTNYTTGTVSQLSLGSDEYLYVEYFTELTTISSAGPATEYTSTFRTGPTYSNPRIVIPTITIPERLLFFLPLFPFVPFLSYWMKKKTLEVAR